MGLTVDMSGLDALVAELDQRILPIARVAMAEAGKQFMADALGEIPTVPLGSRTPPDDMTPSAHPGYLRGSGSVFVDNQLVATSPMTGEGGMPALDIALPQMPNVVEAVVVFNTPYAAYQHEGVRRDGTHRIRRWATPGAGIKFLEKKLLAHGKGYLATAGAAVSMAVSK